MKTRSDIWLIVILLFNVLIATVVFFEWLAPLRSPVVFLYLLFCPGLSLAYLIPTGDTVTRLFLTMMISIAIDTVVALLFLYTKNWSPELILLVLMIISLGAAISELYIKIQRKVYSPS